MNDQPRHDTKMRTTPRQRQALAELVEYSFYTHGHCDHAGWDLAQRIVAAGNKVVVPPRLQADWAWDEPFARQLLVPDHTDSLASVPPIREIGPLGVRLHRGFQIHSRGGFCECNAYLVTTDNGVTIFNKGDASDTGYAGWLARLHSYGIDLDLWIGNIIYGGSSEEIARLFDCFMIPGHDYDMIHGPYVPGTDRWKAGPWGGLYDHYDWHMVRDRAEHIIWGERYHFVPRNDLPPGALALTTVREEVAGFRYDGVTGYFGCEQDTPDETDLAQRQKTPTSATATFRVSVAEGWHDGAARLIRKQAQLAQEPKSLQTSLARYANRAIHLILEIESDGSSEPPTVWLLNPHIVSR